MSQYIVHTWMVVNGDKSTGRKEERPTQRHFGLVVVLYV